MAKSKNHTNHNQNYKAHRNGIKGPLRQRYITRKGMEPKLKKNMKWSLAGSLKKLGKKVKITKPAVKN